MKRFKRSKKAIKVCRMENEKLVSAFNDGYVVAYERGKWTKRPKGCGPLAVFDTMESAEDFVIGECMSHDRKFLCCKYKPSKEEFLYKIYRDGSVQQSFHTPTGTMFADKVKILEKVK